MSERVKRLRWNWGSEQGATMVEYGLMVALVAVVVGVAASALGAAISTMFAGVAAAI
ncbi:MULTISPECIES: Flp family type IVb pilin [unclassified Knoellia]|uniref:Flp family type IVb pilin n=1 Tax=Knoellia altitudinis TaxID=3404795 RepID=UPI0036164504